MGHWLTQNVWTMPRDQYNLPHACSQLRFLLFNWYLRPLSTVHTLNRISGLFDPINKCSLMDIYFSCFLCYFVSRDEYMKMISWYIILIMLLYHWQKGEQELQWKKKKKKTKHIHKNKCLPPNTIMHTLPTKTTTNIVA